MSSRFRTDIALTAVALCALLGAGCDRERREYYAAPTEAAAPHPRLSTLQPGDRLANAADPVGAHYENNAYHINQGSRLYRWFNCNGCHANGGGSIGPALMDDLGMRMAVKCAIRKTLCCKPGPGALHATTSYHAIDKTTPSVRTRLACNLLPQ